MVKIIADTTSCLSEEFARKHAIPIIPQVINFGNESYLEGLTIDIPTFMQRLVTSPTLPQTAAPPPQLFIDEFKRLAPLGETILCIHPSEKVSGTVRSARTAAEGFPGIDIRIIDTQCIASPLASMIQVAAEMADSGASADAIEARLKWMTDHCRIYFMVSTLEYLVKGGRIGGAAGLVGSLLQIKPILTFRNGEVDQFERERTHKRAVTRLKELVISQYPHAQTGYLTVMHAGVLEEGRALAEELKSELGLKEVPIHSMPPAIVTHGGPGILGVGFFVED